MPKWYQYSQNNSGGAYLGPAVEVYVEADSPEHADERAQSIGLYFEGVDSGEDCGCCGDRWARAWAEDGESKAPKNATPFLACTLGRCEREGIHYAVKLRLGSDELEVLPIVHK